MQNPYPRKCAARFLNRIKINSHASVCFEVGVGRYFAEEVLTAQPLTRVLAQQVSQKIVEFMWHLLTKPSAVHLADSVSKPRLLVELGVCVREYHWVLLD